VIDLQHKEDESLKMASAAIKDLTKSGLKIEDTPDDKGVNIDGIILEKRLGKRERARWFTKNILNENGLDFMNQGKYEDAIEAFDSAINSDPQYVEAWYNKGLALQSLGRHDEANAAFARAKELGYTG
jgi:tetratricopeptide (TPR) repeat protein